MHPPARPPPAPTRTRPPAAPQVRTDLATAKNRIKEAEKRIDADLEQYVTKKYW